MTRNHTIPIPTEIMLPHMKSPSWRGALYSDVLILGCYFIRSIFRVTLNSPAVALYR